MGSSFSPYIIALLSLFLFVSTRPAEPSAGPSVQDLARSAGYFSLPSTIAARMFYYFFESRNNNTNDPVVVWLTGGPEPGCSSSLDLFYGNGPYHLTDNLSLVRNDYSWDKEANIIYLDQPIGTGFSYSPNKSDIPTTSKEAAVDFYNFLQAFFGKYPQYAKNDFYITGDSYAGHYIPVFASLIHWKNKYNQGRYINLKGMAIGNGWTNAELQYTAYPDYAFTTKVNNKFLINEAHYTHLINQSVPICQTEIQACGPTNTTACLQAMKDCEGIVRYIESSMNLTNPYDIRKQCNIGSNISFSCYDFSKMERFLNQTSVKEALGVGSNIPFVSCSVAVYEAITAQDRMTNYADLIPELLEDGIKLLVYNGERAFLDNWLGNFIWVADMKWSGQINFSNASTVPFTSDGVKDAGWAKRSGNLTFLTIYDAGSMVSMDQPKVALEILSKWMKGVSL